MDQYNYSDAIVDNNEMQLYLVPLWSEALALTCINPMGLLLRPPKEADLRPDRWKEPTVTWHPPVLLNCGTSSYKDAARIYKACEGDGEAKKRVVCGDMATFIRLWWLKHKYPAMYHNEVPLAGEFHGNTHTVHTHSVHTYSPHIAIYSPHTHKHTTHTTHTHRGTRCLRCRKVQQGVGPLTLGLQVSPISQMALSSSTGPTFWSLSCCTLGFQDSI